MTQPSPTEPLRLAVLGLDARAENLFRMFFRGPCQNSAIVVGTEGAEVTLIDLDVPDGKSIFEQHRQAKPTQTVILLSINEPPPLDDNILFVKKPAQAQTMMKAIADARASSARKSEAIASRTVENNIDQPTLKVVRGPDSRTSTPRQVATLLDEQTFKSYLGFRDDIDPNDPKKIAQLFYKPRDYLQGHIESAWEIALTREQPTRLDTPWRSVSLLPAQRLAHVDANEAQLRAACSIPFKNIASVDIGLGEKQALSNVRTIAPGEMETLLASNQLVPIESFLWKVALLTSKGRLPETLNYREPIGLKHWPNMTRLLLPPHAMRIASSLIYNPMDPFQTATTLRIRQQYVFAFISASQTLGLVEQRSIKHQPVPTPQRAQPGRLSLLQKILNRLRVG